jgi:hypothetical protein
LEWHEGGILFFDDSFEHEVWYNASTTACAAAHADNTADTRPAAAPVLSALSATSAASTYRPVLYFSMWHPQLWGGVRVPLREEEAVEGVMGGGEEEEGGGREAEEEEGGEEEKNSQRQHAQRPHTAIWKEQREQLYDSGKWLHAQLASSPGEPQHSQEPQFDPALSLIFPRTVQVLRQIPNPIAAKFSLLSPGTHIAPHCGPSTTRRVRLHLPLVMKNASCCRRRGGGEERR